MKLLNGRFGFLTTVGALFLASAAAQAAIIDFEADSSGDQAAYTTFSTTVDGITVDVTGTSNEDTTPMVFQDTKGLGVSDEDLHGDLEYDYQCCGNPALQESLLFTFDQTVTIGSVKLEDYEDGTNASLVLFEYGTGILGTPAGSFTITGEADLSSGFDIFDLTIASRLNGAAIDWLRISPQDGDFPDVGDDTNFYVSGFGDEQFGGVVSAVPVPAAVWLFGSALAGLGWMRRKQTA